MAEELWFVYSERTLQDGKSGPRIVAHTERVTDALARLMVRLSEYPASAFPQPVYSHVIVRSGGHEYSILTKLFPLCQETRGGLDYFAQHFLFSTQDRPKGGPAYLFGQPSVFLTSWDGRSGKLPYRKNIPDGEDPPVRCDRWQDIAGDAGWAGVLLRHIDQGKTEPIFLIAEMDVPVIHLLREALAHLAPPQRWELTFSTHERPLPNKVRCQLQVVQPWPGKEAELRKQGDPLIIDLTKPRPCHVVHELVQLTRRGSRVGGRGIWHSQPAPTAGERSRPAASRRSSASSAAAGPASGSQRTAGSRAAAQKQPARRPVPQLGSGSLEGLYAEFDRVERKRHRMQLIKRIAGKLVGLLIGLGVLGGAGYAAWYYWLR